MCGGQGGLPSAMPICMSCAFAQRRCASGKREAVKDMPK